MEPANTIFLPPAYKNEGTPVGNLKVRSTAAAYLPCEFRGLNLCAVDFYRSSKYAIRIEIELMAADTMNTILKSEINRFNDSNIGSLQP